MGKPINRDNDPRWKVLGAYIRDIADRMGLDRWHFNLSHDEPPAQEGREPDSIRAQVTYTYQTPSFNIFFGNCFFTQCCPEEQRDTVVHELCHVIDIPRIGAVDALRQEDCLSTTLWNHWNRHYSMAEERSIAAFANLIAPRYPFIPWPDDDGNTPEPAPKPKAVCTACSRSMGGDLLGVSCHPHPGIDSRYDSAKLNENGDCPHFTPMEKYGGKTHTA